MSSISFETHYGKPAFASFVRERRLSGSSPVQLFDLVQPGGDYSDPPVNELLFCVSLTAHRSTYQVGGIRGAGRIMPGAAMIAPAHSPTLVLIDDPNRFLVVAIPDALARQSLQSLGEDQDRFDYDAFNSRSAPHPLITPLVKRLWQVSLPDHSRLHADALVTSLLGELVRPRERSSPFAKGGLAPWQLRRAKDFMLADLREDVSLAAVAAVVNLSEYHFCRAFKVSTGLPPYRWRQLERIRRAQELLLTTDLPVLTIADRVGYESASQFTSSFRAVLHTTPSAFRRHHRT